MIFSQTKHEKDQLIRDIFGKQKEIASLLLKHDDQKKISHKNFFINNAAITNISLEDLKERHKQITILLEKNKKSRLIRAGYFHYSY
ncbi:MULTISPECIES: hypothetical protein [Bacillus cereus group]|uniref:hypothetical protein n=1 Tax=Bacillus cereus group TaxID=86661 RepID=UPI001AEF23E7|nr:MULTISPECIES: hypothetical protein [Bacillus cereus group]EMA6341675.1 hypothetical protein [Bacillus cytotoxicus]QTR79141.1 hypothetical protein JC773_00690 [Bacillus cytotoxicus]